jgi:streptogramin lyase
MLCNPHPDAENASLGSDCTWSFPVQPGTTYLLTTQHYLWFSPPTDCASDGDGNILEDPLDYFDSGTLNADFQNSGLSETQSLTPSGKYSCMYQTSSIGDIPEDGEFSGAALLATTYANFTAIIASPATASLFQTQQVSQLSSNLPGLQIIAGDDDSVTWCLQTSASNCSTFSTPQGSLSSTDSNNTMYTAPDQIQVDYLMPSNADYACVQEALYPNNYTCSRINLTELALTLNPSTPVSMEQARHQQFKASVNASVGTATISDWDWSVSAGTLTQLQSQGANSSTQQTYDYESPSFNGAQSLTVSVNADLSSKGGRSNLPLSAMATINVNSSLPTQTVSFETISPQTALTTLTLTATASSGLPVNYYYSSTPDICTVSGTTAGLNAGGTCTIVAEQTGNTSYLAATTTQSFTVNFIAQTITFATIPNSIQDQGANALTLTATASSSLPVSLTSTTPAICTVSGSTVSLLALGTRTVQADQAGNAVYAAASTVTQSFTVSSAQLPLGFNFGTVNVGSTSSAVSLTFTFATTTTLGSVAVLTQGAAGLDFANAGTGTCAAGTNYNAGATCSVNVAFAPALSGTRNGAVVLSDNSGNAISTGYLQGIGAGPQVNFLPGAESTVSTSTLSWPYGIAVDGNGNIYVADTSNNRILKETLSVASYTETTVPTSALSFPGGVGVDGRGNIYIADSNNNRILMETPSAGSYIETTIPTSTLNYPEAVAVDGSGNIYIVDTSNNRILKETLSGGSYTESTVPTSTLIYPGGIAIDGNGNVYIADWGNNRVLMETPSSGSYIESTIPSSTLNGPGAVAVVGNSVYIADSGNNRILKETLSAGTYAETVLPTSTLNDPGAVTTDGSGNVYVLDSGNNRVLKEDLIDPPSLSFAATVENSTSSDSPRIVTVSNLGNSTLNFSAISYPTDFPEGSATSDCTVSTSLVAGASCTLTIDFTPVSSLTGTSTLLSEGVQVTTNALNNASSQQTILVNGTETTPTGP